MMKWNKILALLLAGALALTLAACGGETSQEGTPAPEESSQEPKEEEPELKIPGTYEMVGPVPAEAYVLNENGSYDCGEEKGTYSAEADGSRITTQPKDGPSGVTLTACGEYYHTGSKMEEDTEYGLPPSFDESGRSGQSFTVTVDETELALELHEDGSYVFSYSRQSPVYFKLTDVVSYEGSYTLEDGVLSLDYNGSSFRLLFADGAIYPFVYTRKTDANSTVVDAVKAAAQGAEAEAEQGRWWTPVDEALAAEISEHLAGTWEQADEYTLYRLTFDGSNCSMHTEFLGVTAANRYGTFVVSNRAILYTFQNESAYFTNAIPYTYADGVLNLYEMDALQDEASLDPAMDFAAAMERSYEKIS